MHRRNIDRTLLVLGLSIMNPFPRIDALVVIVFIRGVVLLRMRVAYVFVHLRDVDQATTLRLAVPALTPSHGHGFPPHEVRVVHDPLTPTHVQIAHVIRQATELLVIRWIHLLDGDLGRHLHALHDILVREYTQLLRRRLHQPSSPHRARIITFLGTNKIRKRKLFDT